MDIFLFDEIVQGSAQDMRLQLEQANDEDVTIHINSPGGSVPEGIAMASMIKAFKGVTKAEINGLAASMATVIALSTDSVTMVDGSLFMVHNAFFPDGGNATEMRRKADIAENLSKSIVGIYQNKTGLPLDAITDLMNAETALTAGEAKKLGFIDEVIKLQAVAKFDLNQINDMEILKEIKALGKSIGAIAVDESEKEEIDETKKKAEEEAEEEVKKKVEDAEDLQEAIEGQLVPMSEFVAFRDQVLDIIQKMAEFMEAQPTDEQLAENLEKQTEKSLMAALSAIKVKAKVPVKTGEQKILDVEPFPKNKDEKTYRSFNELYREKVQKKLKVN